MGVECVEQGTGHTALRFPIADGYRGRSIVANLYRLWSVDKEVKDPVAKGCAETQFPELGDMSKAGVHSKLSSSSHPVHFSFTGRQELDRWQPIKI